MLSLSHKISLRIGCPTEQALQRMNYVFIQLSAQLKTTYPTATWIQTPKFCTVCHLLLSMVTHHYLQAISSFLHPDLHQATPREDTLFKPHRLILTGLDISSKTHNKTVKGSHSEINQWKESLLPTSQNQRKIYPNLKQR